MNRIHALILILLLAATHNAAAFTSYPGADEPEQSGPVLAADENFYKKQGAHFEYTYENWQVVGDLTDADGNAYDFTALFFKTGQVFMSMRHGFASFNDPAGEGYRYVSFAPATLSRAAKDALTKKLKADPENQYLKDALARIENGESAHFAEFATEAVVFRNQLYIDYGDNHFERTSEKDFVYSLLLNVQGTQLALELRAERDPVSLEGERTIKAGSEGALAGYVFPRVEISGVVITTDRLVRRVTGHARLLQFWGKPDRVAFARYSFISQTLDNGVGFESFQFYNPAGEPQSGITVLVDTDGSSHVAPFSVAELEHWTSDMSGITYPARWEVSGGRIQGEVSLPDRVHELSVQEGAGAFYLGPCDFRGTYGRKETEALGRGVCRLVAPEPQP